MSTQRKITTALRSAQLAPPPHRACAKSVIESTGSATTASHSCAHYTLKRQEHRLAEPKRTAPRTETPALDPFAITQQIDEPFALLALATPPRDEPPPATDDDDVEVAL